MKNKNLIKNKLLVSALGITALTSGILLNNNTKVSALAYANNGSTYTNVDGTELTNVKMLVNEETIMVTMYSYKDLKIKSSTNSYFSANTSYSLTAVTTSSLSSNFSIKLYSSSNKLLQTVSFNKSEDSTINESTMGVTYTYTLTASIKSNVEFYVLFSDSSSSENRLSDYTFSSIKVEETDTTPPTISLSKSEVTYEVGSTGVTVGQIATGCGVKAIDDKDGSVSYYIKSNNVNFSAVGRYYIEIGAKDSAGNESTAYIYVNVVDTQAPVISGYEGVYYTNYDSPTTLSKVLEKISAYDETKGNVPVNVETDGYTGNEKVLGNHYVVLSATDGTNTSKITINIVVVDATAPTISGITALTSNMSNPLTESSVRSMLSVSDNVDSDVSISLVQDNFTSNNQKAGSYTIIYNATDSSGNVSDNYIVTITNKDDIAPVISGDKSINAGSSTKLSLDDIKSRLNVSDNIDSGLTINVVDDNYSNSYTEIGTHTISFNATDNSGNTSDTYIVNIVVTDTTKPVISGVSKYTSNMSNPLTESAIRANLIATDNVDTNLTIDLISDEFTGNEQVFGSFKIKYNVTDNAGNVSDDFVVEVETYDDIPPVITGKNDYSVSTLGKLNLDLVTSALEVSDNDGEVPTYKIVKDGYSDNSTIVGVYEVSYVATDTNGNESSPFVVNIHVIDNIPPVFFISTDFIYVEDTLTLTHQQILEAMLSQADISSSDVNEYNLETLYFESPSSASVYSVRATLKMNDGSVEEIESNIQVLATEEDSDGIEEVGTKEMVNQRVNKIIRFFQNVGEFFVKLWKSIVKYIGFGWAWDKEHKYDVNWKDWN